MKKYFSILLILLAGFTSCKKKVKLNFDKVPVALEGETRYEKYLTPADTAIIDFDFLKAKMRATARLNDQVQSFNTNIRWQKGKRIWMSMSLFGIEGMRVLIDSGSVQWIDRLNGEYHYLPMNKIASKINMDMDFKTIERLLLGLPAIQDTLPTKVTTSDEFVKWETKLHNGLYSTAVFDKTTSNLLDYRAEDFTKQLSLIAQYGDERKIGNKFFAYERLINISRQNDIFELQSKFSEISISNELDFAFDIPGSYKRIIY
ncbi:MAG: DUF4292 domain-containing protein [Chitinophagales bacterium]|nr:DUF4292 domain-containing protein [Chitinophagales bacterium]